MTRHFLKAAGVIAIALAVGCAGQQAEITQDSDQATVEGNVLLAEWTGPYGGVPAFDDMDLDDLKPALETGMERSLADINAIANSTDPPTFENTIVAMERSGRDLDRVFTFYPTCFDVRSIEQVRIRLRPESLSVQRLIAYYD